MITELSKELSSLGLRSDTPSLGDIQKSVRYDYTAICTSQCCKKTVKSVPRSTINCPQCGYVLFWKTRKVYI